MTGREAVPQREWPDTVVMEVPGLTAREARILARQAVNLARLRAPKLTGASAARMAAVFGTGYFGVRWEDPRVWWQEMGIRPFTMRNLAGKVIPMWIDDPTGRERQRNPRARTRVTQSGKVQVLIFRKAARIGERKQVQARGGGMRWVPRSYPGAPGRIVQREATGQWTTPGRMGGRVARGNVGVRWRHPGLVGRMFIHGALLEAAYQQGLAPGQMFAVVGAQYRPHQVQRRRDRRAG